MNQSTDGGKPPDSGRSQPKQLPEADSKATRLSDADVGLGDDVPLKQQYSGLYRLFKEADEDNSGTISKGELREWLTQPPTYEAGSGDGSASPPPAPPVPRKPVRATGKPIGAAPEPVHHSHFEELGDDALKGLHKDLDTDQSGKLSFKEFVAALAPLEDRLHTKLQGEDRYRTLDTVVRRHLFRRALADFRGMGSDDVEASWALTAGPPGFSREFLAAFFAGGLGGTAGRTATAPFDRLRMLLQTGRSNLGMVNLTRELFARDGLAGLWRGNLANCIKVFPGAAIVCSTYVTTLGLMGVESGEAAPAERLAAGATAGCVSTTLTYPLDVVRTRMASALPEGMSAPEPSKAGGGSGAAGASSSSTASRRPLHTQAARPPGNARAMAAAAEVAPRSLHAAALPAAKEASAVANLPSLRGVGQRALSTTLQSAASAVHTATSFTGTFRSIWQKEGLVGLFWGIRPTLLQVTMFVAVQQAGYDILLPQAMRLIEPVRAAEPEALPSVHTSLLTGGFVASMAQLAIHPLDTVRRRMQVSTRHQSGPFRIASELIKASGWKSLYAGIQPALLRVVPAVSVTLMTRDIALGRLSVTQSASGPDDTR